MFHVVVYLWPTLRPRVNEWMNERQNDYQMNERTTKGNPPAEGYRNPPAEG